jgi:hypothetical protein
MMWALGFEEK